MEKHRQKCSRHTKRFIGFNNYSSEILQINFDSEILIQMVRQGKLFYA